MSDDPNSKGDCQDSNNESPTSNGPNSPILIAKQVVSERGALILAVMFAVGMSAWSLARVGYIHDEMARRDADHQGREQQQAAAFSYHATEMQTDYFLHAAQQSREIEHEIVHYREQFAKLERQYRMTELKLDDATVVMHRAGLQLPGDYTRGPQGSLDAESFHVNNRKEN